MASEIAICVVLLIVGIALVVKGGDWFVDAASWIAEVSGIPTFIIGATIVSLATTLPEVLVSCISAAQGNVGLAIGNAVGSVNCNIALIMAISLIFMPVTFKRKDYAAKILLMLVAVAVLWGFASTGAMNIWMSVIVLLIFAAFLIENIYSAKKNASKPLTMADTITVNAYNEVEKNPYIIMNEDGTLSRSNVRKKVDGKDAAKNIVLFILGAGCIVGGAQLMSTYGEKLASILGVPDDIIGVTILAVGTSLPELVTTVTAIAKKKSDLSVGNIVGANIIDLTLILPLCTFISGGSLPVSGQNMMLDLPFCFAVAAVALIPSLLRGRFKRWQGALLLCGYVTYIVLLLLNTLKVVTLF